ncbi:YbaK/EbsC family protein [Agilicoccus flavus]|uniref:YbaK/EbsC family protein n=1 Tax=Agilicoccus flavus TaxID=2775968 RepID=UPI001CF61EDD|nr:YbaK/EbsC family protein [Agilicoccus flavus]
MTREPLPDALDRVRTALAAHGLCDRLVELPGDVPTAADAARELGCDVGAIANSLVFRAGDEPVLVIASGAHRVDVRAAAAHLGVRKLSRADPDFVLAATGQVVGGCAPVGHPAPIRTLVDADLAAHAKVWAGGGVKHAMFHTTHDELLALTGGPSVEVGA